MVPNATLAGSFWSDINDDPFLQDYLDAKHQIERQVQQSLREFRDCVSRETTPLYRRQLIHSLTLRKTQRLDDGSWRLPGQLVSIGSITDKIITPQHIWLDQIDFKLHNRTISFRENPFAGQFAIKPVHDTADITVDEEVTLWLHDAMYDENYLSDLWGAAVGFTAPSSEEYRALLGVVYDAMLGGSARKHVEQVILLLNGGAYAQEDETVVEIAQDSHGLFLATDKRVYRPVENGQPLVTIGAHVQAGDVLFNTVTFHRPTDIEHIKEITLPKAMLDPAIGSDLTFVNREVPLTHTDDRVTFEVGGKPEAVERFWALFNQPVLKTYAAGQPTINPLRFVAQSVLQYNVVVCVLSSPKVPTQLIGIDQNRLLRQLVTPHEMILFAVE